MTRVSATQSEVTLTDRLEQFGIDADLADNIRESGARSRPARTSCSTRSAIPCGAGLADEAGRRELDALLRAAIARKYENITDQKWVDAVQDCIAKAIAMDVPRLTVFASLSIEARWVHDALAAAFAEDGPRFARLSRALTVATQAQTDIFAAHYGAMRRREDSERRGTPGRRLQRGDHERRRAHRRRQPQGPRPGRRRQPGRARHARQDQRGRRRRRAVRGRDARGRPDRRRPDHGDRGSPQRGRGRRRRRHPRRRPGQPGGQGQPGAQRPCRGDRIDPRPDPRHCRPDQFARAQRHDRGGPRRRCRPRLRRRRPGGEEPRQPDRARHRRHRHQDRRHPDRDQADARGQRLDPAARSRRCRPAPTASARRWRCRRRR